MINFDELLTQVIALLQRQGRVSYGALKRRFALDDEYLQDLKDELIDAQRLAIDEGGKILVWTGAPLVPSSKFQVPSAQSPTPSTQHLAPSTQTLDARRQTLDASRPEAERRQLTVMFCDLVGSTALSAQLDPEELRTIIHQYQAVCADVIERYEGYIAQYLGDGVLVYFGYPSAHEDDAQRSVLAALEILTSLREQTWSLSAAPSALQLVPHVRIGIHTGLVVVGDVGAGGRHEQLALGETPNVAARLQGIADPDTVVLSATTHRLIAGYFDCRSLGLQNLKGIPQPLAAYQVLRKSRARYRFEVVTPAHVIPVVGRDEEAEFLLKCWEQAEEGTGQVILLSGEPGIGKSRLVQGLKERLDPTTSLRLEAWCSAYHRSSALYPMIEFLQRSLHLQREEPPGAQLAKLERALARTEVELASTVPFFASLLALPSVHFPLPDLTPHKQREKLQQAMLRWLLKSAERQPVLSIWEDVQWADPSTIEWLGLLLEQTAMTRLLVILTFRPEFTPPWPSRSHVRPLVLSRLGRKDTEAMVEKMTAGKSLPVEVVEQIVLKTDGVPLFVEELGKMVLESGLLREHDRHYELVGLLPPLAIPTTLQDSLLARLDRLSGTREVAQIGAVLGREFSYELLRAIVPTTDEQSLQQDLARLGETEILYQRGIGRRARYIFKHALIQDAAYQSLLKSKRQYYHQRVAQVLEEQFPETGEVQPELLAHHYTEAGLIPQALPYWQKAGQAALQRSANSEAINHFSKALELLKMLPDTVERAQYELALQTTLGVSLMASKGLAAPEVEHTYARAEELCQQVGETAQLFPILVGLHSFHAVRGELRAAYELAQRVYSFAQTAQDRDLLVEAHTCIGNSLYFRGEFLAARSYLEQTSALYDSRQHDLHAYMYGQDPGVVARSALSWALWALGYPEQAVKESQAALHLAHELSHAHTLALALHFATEIHCLRQEWHAAQTLVEKLLIFATDQGLPLWSALGRVEQGWILAGQGSYEEGIAQMCQGSAAYQVTGAALGQTHNFCVLAEACGNTGQVDEGLHFLQEALALAQKNEERAWEAELYRIKGELLLKVE